MRASPRTRDYQGKQVALRALAYRDIQKLWPTLDMDRLDATFPSFAAAVGIVAIARRKMSVALARAYLARLRSDAGLTDLPPAVDDAPSVVDLMVALRFASVVSVKSAMTAGRPLELASRNALVNTMGAVDKYIGDGGREVIRASVAADPAARGWVRRTLGTCSYCAEQAAGDHMHSGGSNFPRHDHCGCQPEPVYASAAVDTVGVPESFVEKFGVKVGTTDDTALANPLRGVSDDYKYNCANSVTSYEMRARGLDVVAKGVDAADIARGGIDVDGFLAKWRTSEGAIPELTRTGGVNGTRDLLKLWPDDSRGFVMVGWKNGSGHVFMVEKVGGVTRYFDPQLNQTYDATIFKQVKARMTFVVRCDDLTPTDAIADLITKAVG